MSEQLELYKSELNHVEQGKVEENKAKHTKFQALGGTALFMGLGIAANMDIGQINATYGTVLSTVGAAASIIISGGAQYLQDLAVHKQEMAKIEMQDLYSSMNPAEKLKVDENAAYQEKIAPLKEDPKGMIASLREKFTNAVDNKKKPTI